MRATMILAALVFGAGPASDPCPKPLSAKRQIKMADKIAGKTVGDNAAAHGMVDASGILACPLKVSSELWRVERNADGKLETIRAAMNKQTGRTYFDEADRAAMAYLSHKDGGWRRRSRSVRLKIERAIRRARDSGNRSHGPTVRDRNETVWIRQAIGGVAASRRDLIESAKMRGAPFERVEFVVHVPEGLASSVDLSELVKKKRIRFVTSVTLFAVREPKYELGIPREIESIEGTAIRIGSWR